MKGFKSNLMLLQLQDDNSNCDVDHDYQLYVDDDDDDDDHEDGLSMSMQSGGQVEKNLEQFEHQIQSATYRLSMYILHHCILILVSKCIWCLKPSISTPPFSP